MNFFPLFYRGSINRGICSQLDAPSLHSLSTTCRRLKLAVAQFFKLGAPIQDVPVMRVMRLSTSRPQFLSENHEVDANDQYMFIYHRRLGKLHVYDIQQNRGSVFQLPSFRRIAVDKSSKTRWASFGKRDVQCDGVRLDFPPGQPDFSIGSKAVSAHFIACHGTGWPVERRILLWKKGVTEEGTPTFTPFNIACSEYFTLLGFCEDYLVGRNPYNLCFVWRLEDSRATRLVHAPNALCHDKTVRGEVGKGAYSSEDNYHVAVAYQGSRVACVSLSMIKVYQLGENPTCTHALTLKHQSPFYNMSRAASLYYPLLFFVKLKVDKTHHLTVFDCERLTLLVEDMPLSLPPQGVFRADAEGLQYYSRIYEDVQYFDLCVRFDYRLASITSMG